MSDRDRILRERDEWRHLHSERVADIHRLVQRVVELETLVDDMAEPGDCWYDHHGYCQEHGWFETDPPCPHRRARQILAKESCSATEGPHDA